MVEAKTDGGNDNGGDCQQIWKVLKIRVHNMNDCEVLLIYSVLLLECLVISHGTEIIDDDIELSSKKKRNKNKK